MRPEIYGLYVRMLKNKQNIDVVKRMWASSGTAITKDLSDILFPGWEKIYLDDGTVAIRRGLGRDARVYSSVSGVKEIIKHG